MLLFLFPASDSHQAESRTNTKAIRTPQGSFALPRHLREREEGFPQFLPRHLDIILGRLLCWYCGLTDCDEFISLATFEISFEHNVAGKFEGLANSATKIAREVLVEFPDSPVIEEKAIPVK